MSCADFDEIKTICIELCKETEDRGVDTPSDELMILPYDIA
jgi:hypothetical protein